MKALGFSEMLVGLFTYETARCSFPEKVTFMFLAVTNFCLTLPSFSVIIRYAALSSLSFNIYSIKSSFLF
jgi:hypothetical protein